MFLNYYLKNCIEIDLVSNDREDSDSDSEGQTMKAFIIFTSSHTHI